MFLQQIVRDRSIPLFPSLSSEQSLCADLLRAKADRAQGAEYIPADDVLASMGQVIEGAEEYCQMV